MAKLGFVGLGLMGSRIVRRLLAAGHEVSGYNRTRAKAGPLIQAGMQWKDTPREVAQAADVTLSMVTDSAALSSITGGPDGILAGLSAGKTYAEMSTVSSRLIRDLARRVTETGASMLEGTALDGLLNSVIASTAMKYRAPFILKMPEEVWFSASMMQKDIYLALELGEELGVPMQTAELANEMLTRAKEMGYGSEDFAVLFRVVEQLSSRHEERNV